MDIFYRGNLLQFSTSFFGPDGLPVVPASAMLTVVDAATSTAVNISMVQTGDLWVAQWDTFGVAPGIIFWSVQAVTPHASDEGYFTLTANAANQAATP